MTKSEQLLQLLEFNYKSHGKKIKTFDFKSKSNPNKSYEVIEWEDGTFSCNCPGWTRRNPPGGRICKHVKSVGGEPFIMGSWENE